MPNRPRVVMITPHGDPLGTIGEPDIGGQCVYIRELAAHLAALGIGVCAFTRDRGDGRPPRETIAPGAEVVRIRCGPEGFIPKEDLLPHLGEFSARVADQLDAGDVLHSHYWDGGYVAHHARTRQPWFHSTHSIGKLKEAALPRDARYRYEERIRIETDVYNGCDRIFALTAIEAGQIAALYGVPQGRLTVIPPGVSVSRFHAAANASENRRRFGLRDRPTVLTLGRLDARKGFDLYLGIAAEAVRRCGAAGLSFVLSAGDGNPQESEEAGKLRRLIEELGLSDVLTWLPVQAEGDVPALYHAADVFVLTSRYEPFGIVILEAMASGVPVVATVHGGPAEIIEPAVDGLLADPMDPGAFAEAVCSLLSSESRRRDLAAHARKKVEEAYKWSAIAARFLHGYGIEPMGVADAR